MKSMRGVSLIEALVALAVMAFGMLGVVAMQTTMRHNADVSKQRSEAVRIAQQAIESRRAFTVLNTTPGKAAYADLASVGAEAVAGVTSNTTFTRTVTIPELGSGRTKTVDVRVRWDDRTGVTQSVRLASAITGNVPDLAATLGLPPLNGVRTFQPGTRHPAIPPAAVDQGDGTSSFAPPGAGTLTWVFNNVSGAITSRCLGTTCTTFNGRLLSGFVNFSRGFVQPTPANAENPTGAASLFPIRVRQTFPASQNIDCFVGLFPTYLAYFCAMPVDTAQGGKWSGRTELQMGSLVSSINDDDDDKFKVCRYTPVRGSHPVVPAISNEEHPLDYADVAVSLSSQNFLVIRAGDDRDPFVCPADDPVTPLVNGNTWYHQPSN